MKFAQKIGLLGTKYTHNLAQAEFKSAESDSYIVGDFKVHLDEQEILRTEYFTNLIFMNAKIHPLLFFSRKMDLTTPGKGVKFPDVRTYFYSPLSNSLPLSTSLIFTAISYFLEVNMFHVAKVQICHRGQKNQPEMCGQIRFALQ